MTPISTIHPSQILSFRLKNRPISITSAISQNPDTRSVDQAQINLSNAVSINLLPQGPVNDIIHIIQQMNTQVLQSLELGQTFGNRQLLQEKITEDVSNLRTVFEGFSQDDLKLFATLFQNQPFVGPDNSNIGQNFFNTNFSQYGVLEDFMENLFSIDVTSQNSSLTALDITGSILDILSTKDSESRQLESLLERLTDLSSSSTLIEETEQSQDDTIVQQGFNIDQFIVQNLFLNSIPFKLKQSTSIDLVG